MNAPTTALHAADLAAHPSLCALRWGAGEDPMSKDVWYAAADHARGLVLVLRAPCPDTWLGAPHGWNWTIFDRAGSRPGPAAESARGFATAAEAAADLAAALERVVEASYRAVPAGA